MSSTAAMPRRDGFDVIVIGAGIAGASLAAVLAREVRVLVLEAEAQPGYHATGRSAATYEPGYGPPVIRRLTRASGTYFRDPPTGFSQVPLLSPRGQAMFAADGDERYVDEALGLGMRQLSMTDARRMLPALKVDAVRAVLYDEQVCDIDVDALHGGYLRSVKAGGGRLLSNARVEAISREADGWSVRTGAGRFGAGVVVNAAGAWADAVAGLAGIAPLGIQPRRRSAALLPVPPDWDLMTWPAL